MLKSALEKVLKTVRNIYSVLQLKCRYVRTYMLHFTSICLHSYKRRVDNKCTQFHLLLNRLLFPNL